MGDGLKLSKDKRHKSSSSLAGVILDGTRSERKLDVKAIPEVEDQFALAEACCDDLQEKIDLVKSLKRKKKLRKRSMTRVTEQPPDNVPFISVRTQPKKKLPAQAARLRRLDLPRNPTRCYLDPATVEQHQMIGQVGGYNHLSQETQQPHDKPKSKQSLSDMTPAGIRRQERRAHADGDREDQQPVWRSNVSSVPHRVVTSSKTLQNAVMNPTHKKEERPVVELFKKGHPGTELRSRGFHQVEDPRAKNTSTYGIHKNEEHVTDTMEFDDEKAEVRKKVSQHRNPRRVKYRSRRYELPTVASQMKQAGVRYYAGTANNTNIPFVVSKSTAPSHNIGVNIQQVLNGLKIQQPLSGIPYTIAHHMGLGHVPIYNTKLQTTAQPSLDSREMNAIRLGSRLLRLPSYKYMSYNRLLSLYREGDGMVSRFLRAISRPHYFYTSMYNLTIHDDFDGSTSKGRGATQEAKNSLAEYATLYREYEQVEKCLAEGNYDPELEQRKDYLTRELAAREEHIRKVVQDYRTGGDVEQTTLRASVSTADDSYRHSGYKLNLGAAQL